MKIRYESELNKTNEVISRLNKKYQTVSIIRLAVFVLAALLIIMGISGSSLFMKMSGILLVILFVWMVKYHAGINNMIELNDARKTVLEGYVKRMDGSWNELKEDGSEFIREDDTVIKDIDLMGKNSLYQMICTAHTDIGREKLAQAIRLENFDEKSLSERRKAILEIAGKESFAIDFETLSLKAEKTGKRSNRSGVMDCDKKISWGMNFLRFLIPAINLIFIILTVLDITPYIYIVISFFASLFIMWLTKSATDKLIMPYYIFGYAADEYLEMFKCIASENFESRILSEIHDTVSGENGALKAMSRLKVINQAFNISYNPIIHQILSGFTAWDYHIAYAVSKWNSKYGIYFSKYFEGIGKIEEFISLSVMERVRNTTSADISFKKEKAQDIVCENLYHPLIDMDKVIANTVTITPGVTIITGSNMSGKTTFLRTVAINLVLAYMGAGVCADKFSAGYMRIFTSMRVTDDVAGGVSTFYAEILRIKNMIDYMNNKSSVPMICFIDEIFKGTNSADRLVGATKVIKRLSESGGITMVSTHDFELCDITDSAGNQADNYHFEEYYEDGKLKFDYKIKQSRCTTRNAMEILKMAGLY